MGQRVRFDIRINPEKVDALRQIARRKSYIEKQNITWAEIVRRAIDEKVAREHEQSCCQHQA